MRLLEQIRNLRTQRLAQRPQLDLERIVVIATASRGLSSLLFELLRRTGAFLTLPGEHTQLYKIHEFVDLGDPEALDDSSVSPRASPSALVTDLLASCGMWTDPHDRVDQGVALEQSRELALFLCCQWPDMSDRFEEVVRQVTSSIVHVSPRGSYVDLLLHVAQHLAHAGFEISPWYYDIDRGAIPTSFGRPPQGPPPVSLVLEEPPFLVPVCSSPSERRPRVLLLKSPSDAYRLDQLGRMFAPVPVSVVHLTRNPGASINGLIDGWLSHGFYSRDVSSCARLDIEGYEGGAWTAAWWNFDLPPGWQSYTASSLGEVCGFQWRSAHTAILRCTADDPSAVVRARAEDLYIEESRTQLLLRLLDLAAAGSGQIPTALPRTVMGTAAPSPHRWFVRRHTVERVVRGEEISVLSAALGYPPLVEGDAGPAWR